VTQGRNADATSGGAPQPFAVEVPQEKLDRIGQRVAEYRWETLNDLGDWRFGPPVGYARRVAEHWLNAYDWREAERDLNRFAHFKARVGGGTDGVELHFVHERGSGTNPGAVVLIHGWPSSPYDFWEMIEPLAHPERFGGDAEDGVDVVVPSVAGYAWSGRPPMGPQGRRAEAAQIHALMTGVLGYEHYVAGGGDFGAMISAWAAVDHPEAVRGIHIHAPNVCPAGGGFFETNPPEDFTREEREYLFWEMGYLQARLSYAQVQGASPQTFAYAMMDSPVGQAVWLLEKFQRWTDESGERTPDEIFGMDRLLTAVMIYLITDSFDTSIWAYPGLYLDPPTLELGQRVEAPTALVACADPLVPVPPRSFVERTYNVVRWTDMPEAGHFAAFQRPGPVLEDLQVFLRLIRGNDPGAGA
jgi:microsomal epoxide hydrolase